MKQTSKSPEATVKPNLFTSAKKIKSKKESKSKVLSLPVPPELEKPLITYVEAKNHVKDWTSKKVMVEGVIKDKAKELFLTEYKKQGRNIGSFMLKNVLISFQDKYKEMDEDVTKAVAKKYPNVVETTTVYLFNQEILKEYINEISDALQNAKGIPAAVLASLIEAKEVFTVKKGAIDTLASYGDEMDDVFQAISPIISMH